MFVYFALIFAFANADTSDMNMENARILAREQNGGTVMAARKWSCDSVQLEMARYGHVINDCAMHDGNIWFRIDTAMTWQDSWQACHAIAGGNLASIHNTRDFSIVRNLYWFESWKSAGNWLGLNKILAMDAFKWSDGTKLDYEKWIPTNVEKEKKNCIFYGTFIGAIQKNNYAWIDGFMSDDCHQSKMPICTVVNA